MMDMLLNLSCCCGKSRPCNSTTTFHPLGVNLAGPRSAEMTPSRTLGGCRVSMKYVGGHNAVKKPKKRGRSQKFETSPPIKPAPEEKGEVMSDVPPLADDSVEEKSGISSFNKPEEQSTILVPSSRGAVLQACTITSCLIGGLGVVIRQVSHLASTEGLPVIDCSEISFGYEPWHIGLVAGLVVVVSSCRYILLNTWADFAESSEAANRLVLSSLEPLDYVVVAFLPGISEEILFRGAILPLFGMNWTTAVAVGALFGILHLGSRRNYSFALWAALVGVAYGCATVVSSSIVVPMASHAFNNLVAGIVWQRRNTSSSSNSPTK